MLAVGQQKADSVLLAALVIFLAAATVLAIALPQLMPWTFLALAAAAVFIYWTARWEITLFAWIWVLSYGLMDRPVWFLEIPGFFNITIPRLVFLGAVAGFGLYLMVRKRRVFFDRPILWVMVILLVYVAINATMAGWTAEVAIQRSAPYYRFLGPLLFPFIIFFFVYNSTEREKQIKWALIAFSIYGWYALYIGYLQYAAIRGMGGARELIWPSYINQPSWHGGMGIHFDRARGAYTMAYPQIILLVFLFYSTLYLIRKIRGPYRVALVVQAILIPPAIFFAGLRAGYLAFLLCGIVWCLWGCKGRSGKSKLAIVGMVLILTVFMFWENLQTTQRATGGVAQQKEIASRLALNRQALEMAIEHPLTGVGFGHSADAQQKLRRDPASAEAKVIIGAQTQHNLLLVMLSETGVIGLTLTVALFYLVFRESLALYRKIPPNAAGLLSRDFVVLFWVLMVNYLTNSMFNDPLWDVPSNGLFWGLAALVVGYNRLLKPQPLDLLSAATKR